MLLLALTGLAIGGDVLTIDETRLDRPTHHALGVQVLIADDDDRDATITVRYREPGGEWRTGPPLLRVWPETSARAVEDQFAGSVFDLSPATAYEIELHAVDPDGVDETITIEGATRPLPPDEPANPRVVDVATVDELKAALAAAAPGDVITLAPGTYVAEFLSISASGTEADPIVLRGAGESTILDGGGCDGCNILEIYGSFVTVEDLALRGAIRAIRHQGTGTMGNVVRRVHISDVQHGIGSGTAQLDFTICDNVIEGRLEWPLISTDDNAAHNDDQGIRVAGDGHVVCHNHLSGFGDPMLNFEENARSYDFYGNDIVDIYGDGTELDRGEGNVRLWGNRFVNSFTAISIQPVYGGPAYVLRNVAVNVVDEQVKLHSLGGTDEPSGVFVQHNTFVSPDLALNGQTPITQHHTRVENNLFIGPATTERGYTADWTAVLNDVVFDGNGWYPDGSFWLGTTTDGTRRVYTSFAEMQAAGVETNGVLLPAPPFASGLVAPADYTEHIVDPDVTLAEGSAAVDAGLVLPGINGSAVGAGPDLGALELGCAPFVWGPRPRGDEAITNPVDCAADTSGGGGGDDSDDTDPVGGNDDGPSEAGDPSGAEEGCGCGTTAPTGLGALLLAGALTRRRRRA